MKIYLMPALFITVSLISVTMAWFAYSGLVSTDVDIGVKAWNIELEKDGQIVSNDIVISLDEIYPGMETANEMVKIKNLGDSDASVSYSIVSARILGNPEDNYIVGGSNTSEVVEDKLSHNYPFNINISLNKDYIQSNDGESIFNVAVSWPLDSGNNQADSLWGNNAYSFQKSESEAKAANSSYEIRPAIKIKIKVIAEQYISTPNSINPIYGIGDEVLYDPIADDVCITIGGNCIKTFIINKDNTLGKATLLPAVNEDEAGNIFSKTQTNFVPDIGYDYIYSKWTDGAGARWYYVPVDSNATYVVSQPVGSFMRVATSVDVPALGVSITNNVQRAKGTTGNITITTGPNDHYLSFQPKSMSETDLNWQQVIEDLIVKKDGVEEIETNITYSSGNFSNYNSLMPSNWTATNRALTIKDILTLISNDINNSLLIRTGLTDSTIGSMNSDATINNELLKITNNAYYKFSRQNFKYLSSNQCYWMNSEYDANRGFAISNIDTNNSKVYGEMKSSNCKVIPVIIIDKSKLE